MMPKDWAIGLMLARIPGYDGEPHRFMGSAEFVRVVSGNSTINVNLNPLWRSNMYARVTLTGISDSELRPGWVVGTATLEVDGQFFGQMPFTLYAGERLDEPSMLVKFPEVWGPEPEGKGAGTWILTGRRSA